MKLDLVPFPNWASIALSFSISGIPAPTRRDGNYLGLGLSAQFAI